MSDVYNIQTVMTLGGNLAPELAKILKNMQAVDKGAKSVEKSLGRWAAPIDRAVTSMGRLSREMGNVQRGAARVEREHTKISRSLHGLRAPASGMDREMAKWATAMGRPLASMGNMRSATQGVAASARGVTQSISGWAGRINAATAAMRRMNSAAAGMHMPSGGGGAGGGRGRSGGNRRPNYRHNDGSFVATAGATAASVGTMEYMIEQGAAHTREDVRAKNSGLTPGQIGEIRTLAEGLAKTHPSLNQVDMREQARMLIPNTGSFDMMKKLLPTYAEAQVALSSTGGPNGGAKSMHTLQKYVDVIGRSMSESDTKSLVDDFVRVQQVDPDAVSSNDFLSAAKASGTMGAGLGVGFWGRVAPALFSQQGGARTGTDLASAYQNTVVGRGSKESLMAQNESGWRTGMTFDAKGKIKNKGGLVDEALMSSRPDEWVKKHAMPVMVKRGMLPEGYAKGDYSQELSEKQRTDSTKFLSDRFSNRRGANIFSMMIQQFAQLDKFFESMSRARGVQDVLSDQRADPMLALTGAKTAAGSAASAVAEPAVPMLTDALNRVTAALTSLSGSARDNPAGAQTAFGTALAATGGIAAAGLTALTIAGAGMVLTVPAVTIGTGAAITIAALTIPWGQLYDALPAPAQRALSSAGQGASIAAGIEGGSALGEIEARNRQRNLSTSGLGLSSENVKAATDRLGQTAGPGAAEAAQAATAAAGQAARDLVVAAQRVPPPMLQAAEGFNSVAGAANGVPGALNGAAGAISGFVSKILGSLNAAGVAGPPSAGSGAPAAAGTPGKTSAVMKGGAVAPVHVATTVNLDGRKMAQNVTRHQVAANDTRNGTGGFDSNRLKTPVGFSAPTQA